MQSFTSVYDDRQKVDTITNFEARENNIKDDGELELDQDTPITVEFKNVSFACPQTTYNVLNKLSFRTDALEKVCLLGVNGAGKSTIIKLLFRFYDVDDGQILIINGYDIREYTLKSLRRSFSIFFQQSAMYAFTLAENITVSDYKRNSNDDIMKAIKLAGADMVMRKLPNGLDSYIGRVFDVNGYEPSGGEVQKIALARAIYRQSNAAICIAINTLITSM